MHDPRFELFEISRLQARYGDVVTRQAWDELEALFAPGAPVTIDTRTGQVIELVGAAAVGAFIAKAIERFEHFEFAMLNAVADLDEGGDDRDRSRLHLGDPGRPRHRPLDQRLRALRRPLRQAGGALGIAQRSYSSLARTAPDLEVFGFPS